MSMMYCIYCDRQVDTDFMDHCNFNARYDSFMCEDCVDRYDDDPTPDEEGEPPITWKERASWEKPR